MKKVFVPSRGFLFFYEIHFTIATIRTAVFVPSRGFLFFYREEDIHTAFSYGFRPLTGISLFLWPSKINRNIIFDAFSSPHGDFSFSIETCYTSKFEKPCFRPLTGISLFL